MDLKPEGLKAYGKILDNLEKFEIEYRKKLTEEQCKKPLYVNGEFIDYGSSYEITLGRLTRTMSREESYEIFRKELDDYYSK